VDGVGWKNAEAGSIYCCWYSPRQSRIRRRVWQCRRIIESIIDWDTTLIKIGINCLNLVISSSHCTIKAIPIKSELPLIAQWYQRVCTVCDPTNPNFEVSSLQFRDGYFP